MKTKLLLGTLSAAATLAVAPAVFADDDEEGTTTPGSVTGLTDEGSDDTYTTNTGTVVIDSEFSIEAKRKATYTDSEGEEHEYTGFEGVSITTRGKVEGYELTITGEKDEETDTTTTDQNVYFIGANMDGTDSLTITSLEVDNGTSNKSYKTTKSFIVEGCTLTLDGSEDGINVTELGMSLNIGTMYDATVNIIDGAQLRTGGYLNTIGSNMATATINISGEGSLLDTQQVTVGGGVNSLFAGTMTTDGDYWVQYLISDEDREAVIEALLNPELKGTFNYGIINVTDGGTWQVGVGNTDWSTSKLQLANGEINIAGEGSKLILGNNSVFTMGSESGFADSDGNAITGTYWTQKVSVTNGGSITVEDEGTLYSAQIGLLNYGSNNEVEILVDGKDESGNASIVDLSVSGNNAFIGYKSNDYAGGTEVVTITASNGGIFNFSATGSISIASDNSSGSVHSDGINVSISAELGGSVNITGGSSGAFYICTGSTTSGDGANSASFTADGEGSEVKISGNQFQIVASCNWGSSGDASFTAKDGGYLSLESVTGNNIFLGYATRGGSISFTADNGILNISSKNIDINYQADDVYVDFTAKNGGTLTINADNQLIFSYLAYYTSDVSRGSTVTADGAGSTVTISAASIYTSYSTTYGKGASNKFIASDGGTLDISASTIALGYAGSGETTMTATGTGSTLALSGSIVYVNFQTPTDFTSSFTAEDGGSLSIAATDTIYFGVNNTGYGDINIAATGTGSVVDISATNYLYTNNWATSLSVNIDAKDGGTVKLSSQYIYLCYNTDVVADNGGTIEISAQSSPYGYNIWLSGASISVTNNSTLITNDISVENGSSVTIDATSTWQGGWTELYNGSKVSIAVGADAITLLASDSGTNATLGDVFIANGASITVTIDVSSLGYNESASVAIFSADSVTFNTTWAVVGSTYDGTTLTESNVNAFAAGYISADENGYTVDSWEWKDNTLYANITTTPEPSMFSLFLGLAAIALTATRRRRRNQ